MTSSSSQSVEGLAKGTGVTFSRRSGRPGQVDQPRCRRSPQFVRVRISVDEETPVLEGTTATIRGVGFTGVSQIQLDPPEQRARAAARAGREIRCPETESPVRNAPMAYPVIPTKPGALGQLLNTRAGAARAGLDADRAAHRHCCPTATRNRSPASSTMSRRVSRNLAERSPRSPPPSPRRGSPSARPAPPPSRSASSPAPTDGPAQRATAGR